MLLFFSLSLLLSSFLIPYSTSILFSSSHFFSVQIMSIRLTSFGWSKNYEKEKKKKRTREREEENRYFHQHTDFYFELLVIDVTTSFHKRSDLEIICKMLTLNEHISHKHIKLYVNTCLALFFSRHMSIGGSSNFPSNDVLSDRTISNAWWTHRRIHIEILDYLLSHDQLMQKWVCWKYQSTKKIQQKNACKWTNTSLMISWLYSSIKWINRLHAPQYVHKH